jgi:NTE family protein
MALVLAEGNAPWAFEAGAYQALHDHGLWPNWVAGTSTGAVNGAIIVGNPRERRTNARHKG